MSKNNQNSNSLSTANVASNKTGHYFSTSFREGVSFGSFLSICDHPIIITALGAILPNLKNDHDTMHTILATSLAFGMPYFIKNKNDIPATFIGEIAGFLFATTLQEISSIFKPSNQLGAYLSIGIWYYRAEILGKSAIGSFINSGASQLNEEYPLLDEVTNLIAANILPGIASTSNQSVGLRHSCGAYL